MPGHYRWAKEMSNPNEHYDRLHEHCQALARERNYLERLVAELKLELESARTLLGLDK
jgi:branched-subunit amino acid aminotransferase/4-amino-4-deoxychorismate lyase